MKIAFLHYHLKTGGVTTVLRRQIAAVAGPCDTMVLTGDRAGTRWPCPVVEIPEIGYDRPESAPPAPAAAAEKVLQAMAGRWPGGCDVLHIHNPTLAKNRRFLQIIERLQRAGVVLLLQIHDFAEDGRPGVYFREPYPPDCHYGVINSRDRRILLSAGLDAAGVHLIPNAVHPLPVKPQRRPEPFVLYPIRALRRKNLGEAVLVSLFLKEGGGLAVSQPPNSPQDRASYAAWKRYVKAKGLEVHFEVGLKDDFAACVGAATSMVTTSIAEGFGFSFLEPWTAGKLLWGRRLGEICRDFEQNGVRLDFLYDRLEVPFDWLDPAVFARRWRRAAFTAAAAYDHPLTPATVDRGLEALMQNPRVDFGLLDEILQRHILDRLLTDAAARSKLAALNPFLEQPGTVAEEAAVIDDNRRAVADHYGAERCRERLLEVYARVVGRSVRHRIDKGVLLGAFFDLARFPLLKWGTGVD